MGISSRPEKNSIGSPSKEDDVMLSECSGKIARSLSVNIWMWYSQNSYSIAKLFPEGSRGTFTPNKAKAYALCKRVFTYTCTCTSGAAYSSGVCQPPLDRSGPALTGVEYVPAFKVITEYRTDHRERLNWLH